MKGRWRKDKRASTQKSSHGSITAEHVNGESCLNEQVQHNSLKGFKFSGTLTNASEQQRACYASAHASLVRSQFAMCDGQTHEDFMVRPIAVEMNTLETVRARQR